ncbi:MAG: hypothetical protein PHU12_04040 [Candidatus Aenigmarchaeota archaeon]|nr:hypothetical protein [Candidatus Aenigmarchaeota archaeon]
MRRDRKEIDKKEDKSELPSRGLVEAANLSSMSISTALRSIDPFKTYDLEFNGIIYTVKKIGSDYDITRNGERISKELKKKLVKYISEGS